MITPVFTVSQDDDFITIVLNVPHIRTQDVDFFVEGQEFKFYLKPYFLRLTLPGNVVEDDRSKATYDVGAGKMTVTLPKETPGEYFPDLDMLTRLLVRNGTTTSSTNPAKLGNSTQQSKRPLIEVVQDANGLQDTDTAEYEDFDWQEPQQVSQEPELISEVRYGFNNLYNGFFTHVQETANEVLDVYAPEQSNVESRRENRLERENEKFDDEYYMNDFMQAEDIQHIFDYKTPWWNELRKVQRAEKAKGKDTATGKNNAESAVPAKKPKISPGSLLIATNSKAENIPKSSIFNIVARDEDEEPTTLSIGLQEVSTTKIRPLVVEQSSSSSLLSESVSTPSKITAGDDLQDDMMVKPSGLIASMTVIDSSRPSTANNISADLKGLSLDDGDSVAATTLPFSDKEQTLMRDLPKREYLLHNPKSTYLSLIDILFAYSYNLRVTEGEDTVETGWTICKLSATIAGLEQFTTLQDTLTACYRRSLAYPLYRNWNLSTKIIREDVYALLKLGRRGILKALLALKDLLDHDDIYYIYSKMFIEDYCVWIQSANEGVIKTLAREVRHFELPKEAIGWHLEELEKLATEGPEEEEDEESEDDDSDEDTSSEESDSDDDDDDSDDDEDDEDEYVDETKEEEPKETNEQDTFVKGDEESIFEYDGPRPSIIML